MAKIIFISGGQRSGKSSYAQKMALQLSECPIYLATSRVWDEEFAKRVKRHKLDRDERWKTIEEEKHIGAVMLKEKDVVLLECITLWLTNFFTDPEQDVGKVLEIVKNEWDAFVKKEITVIAVTNEIGMGLHAPSAVGRKFTDLQGFMNQYIAAQAEEAYFMISGIPMKVK